MPAFLDPAEAEFWVGVGLILFFVILVIAKVPALVLGNLDAKRDKIQSDLDEAARLRAEAEALLVSIRAQRTETEQQAVTMLANARAEAEQMQKNAAVQLEERIARRQQLAERKIANAESQAVAEVKAAAAEMAARATEQVLAGRVARGEPDPSLDRGIAQLGARFS
jgi:F-type H+-transporting ATPase subunit b